MWIWQQAKWPTFNWRSEEVEPLLRKVRFNQGVLLGKMTAIESDTQRTILDTLLANIVHSSAIEGEKLNAYSVRSSLANRLGLSEEKPYATSEQSDGLADIALDAVTNLQPTVPC